MIRATSLFAALLVVVGVFAVPAVAASDSVVANLTDDEDDDILPEIDEIAAAAQAAIQRVQYRVSEMSPLSEGTTDAKVSEWAEDLETEFDSNNKTYTSYLNERVDASTDRNVVRVTLCDDGHTATRYLVANVSSGNYTDARMVDSTSKTVDAWVTLSGYAAENAAEELQYFREHLAEDGKTVGGQYVSRLAGKYAGSAATSFLDQQKTCQV